jgi:indole-3-glycerol phosphate synthase
MNILDQIIAKKADEVAERKSLYPAKLLEQSIYFENTPVSLKKYLLRKDKSGIIAEIKRKSPSKGMMNPHIPIERVSIGYMQAGASALSVLTNREFFGGSNDDLTTARKYNFCPILRKDFIIDEYQVLEAKSIGADAILLIAAALEADKVKHLAGVAKSLGLETLLEVHNEEEMLHALSDDVDLVGVNNRDLTTFEVSLETSMNLVGKIPTDFCKVAESGISSPKQVVELKEAGFDGFLIGGSFMEHSRPEKACASFIMELSELEKREYAKQ